MNVTISANHRVQQMESSSLRGGESCRVIAADLQGRMLQKVKEKVKGTEFEERISLHKCGEDNIEVLELVDFVLLFYMGHEVPNKEHFFNEIRTILKPQGQALIVEPPFHVSKSAFEETVRKAGGAGFVVIERPKVFFRDVLPFIRPLLLGKNPFA